MANPTKKRCKSIQRYVKNYQCYLLPNNASWTPYQPLRKKILGSATATLLSMCIYMRINIQDKHKTYSLRGAEEMQVCR